VVNGDVIFVFNMRSSMSVEKKRLVVVGVSGGENGGR